MAASQGARALAHMSQSNRDKVFGGGKLKKSQNPGGGSSENNNNHEVIDLSSDSDSDSDKIETITPSITSELANSKRSADQSASDNSIVELSSSSDDDEEEEEKANATKPNEKTDEQSDKADGERSKVSATPTSLEESEDDMEVITLSDDDVKEIIISESESSLKKADVFRCLRCATKKAGACKTKKAYMLHINRHRFGEVFQCPTCRRTFTSLNSCFVHEIVEHGTEIDNEDSDRKIAKAKAFLQRKREGAKNRTGDSDDTQLKTDEQDCFDEFALGERVVSSCTLHPYMGPRINHILECYEIQLYQSKVKGYACNTIAGIAIEIHNENVEKEYDTYKLGRFSKKKAFTKKPSRRASPMKRARVEDNELVDLASSSEAGSSSNKRVKFADSYLAGCSSPSSVYSTSSSTFTSAYSTVPHHDSSYLPSTILPPPRPQKELSPAKSDNSSDSDYDPAQSKQKDESLSNFGYDKKKKKPNRAIKASSFTAVLPPILTRVCLKCNYSWSTDSDLRKHRDEVHPYDQIIDLISIPNPNPAPKQIRRKRKRKYSLVPNDILESAILNTKRAKTRNKTRSKSKRITFPVPNATYTEKELFLHSLGLYNNVRFELQLKTPLDQIKLPKCSVRVEKMNDMLFEYYMNRDRDPEFTTSQMGFHFLLFP